MILTGEKQQITINSGQSETIVLTVSDMSADLEITISGGAELNLILKQTAVNAKALTTNTTINCEANSRINISTVNIEPRGIANTLIVNLNGEGAEAMLNGLYVVGGEGSIENRTEIHHHAPHCTSTELYKGILDGKAVAKFAGLIQVAPGAQKTAARQTNRHLLLSPDAHGYAQPHLIINADDVKCSHGATSGQIDREQLFYMQQRGIDAATAQRLLVAAFANEVVALIPDEATRQELTALLSADV